MSRDAAAPHSASLRPRGLTGYRAAVAAARAAGGIDAPLVVNLIGASNALARAYAAVRRHPRDPRRAASHARTGGPPMSALVDLVVIAFQALGVIALGVAAAFVLPPAFAAIGWAIQGAAP